MLSAHVPQAFGAQRRYIAAETTLASGRIVRTDQRERNGPVDILVGDHLTILMWQELANSEAEAERETRLDTAARLLEVVG